jgi:hypothetical protein
MECLLLLFRSEGCALATLSITAKKKRNEFGWEQHMQNSLSRLLSVAGIAFCLVPVPDARAQPPDTFVDLGGLKSRVPVDWTEEQRDDPQSYKQYRLEPVDDDKYYGEVAIYSISKGKNQEAADYVKQWKTMFLPPEGLTIKEAAKLRKLTVNGSAATYLDVRGDLKGIAGDDTTPRQDFRLLAVYLRTPKGAYIIRMLGPAGTVEHYRKGFESWIMALK